MSRKVRESLYTLAFMTGYESIVAIGAIVLVLGAGAIYGRKDRLSTLSARFETCADLNRDGRVSPDEMMEVYETLGKEHGPTSVPPLSLNDMERYIGLRAESRP